MAALAAILDIDCDNILEILNLNITPMPPLWFRLKLTSCSRGFFFFFSKKKQKEKIHIGCQNRRNLAILNLRVALMLHLKFQLNQIFGYIADKNFKMATMAASRHLGYQDETILAFLNIHVAPIPSMKFRLNPTFCLGGDASFEEFQDDHHGGHHGYQDGNIFAILILHAAPIPHTKFFPVREMSFEEFQDGRHGGHF